MEVLSQGIEPGARINAYHRLGGMAAKMNESDRREALALLTQGVAEEASPLARSAAVGALAHFHEPEAVEALERAAGDPSPMVRAEVCKVFGERKSEASIAIVGRLANFDTDLDVRTAATQALVDIHSPRCNPHLLECLNDKGVGVSTLAAKGLRENTDVDLGMSHDAWAQYLKDGSIPPGARNVAEQSFFRKLLR